VMNGGVAAGREVTGACGKPQRHPADGGYAATARELKHGRAFLYLVVEHYVEK